MLKTKLGYAGTCVEMKFCLLQSASTCLIVKIQFGFAFFFCFFLPRQVITSSHEIG